MSKNSLVKFTHSYSLNIFSQIQIMGNYEAFAQEFLEKLKKYFIIFFSDVYI